ncbi:hypothetical protein K0M31_016471 [Melipona bicolor]|uniref:Uncharacterized protein n=1 Tax=Melipona bicolor TaxID=60889 RepID=A0AA40G7X6_9HYME|nr:hypothetical protein K0M31_016471 [Melipona bicolor]
MAAFRRDQKTTPPSGILVAEAGTWNTTNAFAASKRQRRDCQTHIGTSAPDERKSPSPSSSRIKLIFDSYGRTVNDPDEDGGDRFPIWRTPYYRLELSSALRSASLYDGLALHVSEEPYRGVYQPTQQPVGISWVVAARRRRRRDETRRDETRSVERPDQSRGKKRESNKSTRG